MNFANALLCRLGKAPHLIDGASGARLDDVRGHVIASAAMLREAGLERGDRLLLAAQLDLDTVVAYLATMYAGCVAVPLPAAQCFAEAGTFAGATGAKAIWSSTLRESSALPVIVGVAQGDMQDGNVGAEPTDIAVLNATSGSTGKPRLVMVSHANLLTNTEAIVRSQLLTSDDRALLQLPLHYCFGASVLHSHLWAGGSVVVDRRSMFPNRLIGSTIDHACTSFAGVPFTYEQMIAAADFDRLAGSSLKRFLQAGGKLDVQVVESIVARVPSADFYVMYGQTEATSRISTFEVHRHTAKLGSAGMPLDNLKVFPVGADFRPLAAGRSGELAVCGPSVAAGFWNDVDGTAERFVNGTLLTGDVGHVDEDGFIWIEGRIADFLKMRGMRVSIGEIEARLRLAEGISEIAAFPACHPRHGEAFGLAVVAEKEHDRAGIVRDLTRRIDPLWICAGINFVDSLPRNDVGKILRGRLAEKCGS